MRLLLFALLSLSFSTSFATTRGQFVGLQMLVNIWSTSYDGSVDGSPQVLFEAMDRPEQDSMVGRGKVLDTPQKVLNFICAKKGENNYQCSITIHRSNFASIGPGKAQFVARGADAKAIFEQFHTQNDRFSYRDEMSTFSIEATPDIFVMKFNAQGL
ncbi:hypothetical protein [Bdellovibrio sp. HCB-162]|uniref:hypothetical protein n=1 Tax=Bdellovibrio sp. HCB-162 TaxID=3394234 RepID=UPI0039BD6CA4